ncbi:hypothetical protein AG1IA_07146 [Rhizoctonia solani AG-1 IA]|uniref:Uncharacterized protein n=1 Tax=Thanatephorus cucumeris (strain AG1-IA) TaxID=983506 RepID=L8WLM2_THACA|nr:hypothetical protein AG1IA_07146 [Rhizoctonia solani AG-1 IA]
MTLTISYEPPEGGRPWYADVEPSESYEGVINAACALWKNRLPSDECIIGRYLARQIKRHGEIEWARISEARFIQLVRDSPEELELRLELDTQIGRRHYRETSTPSSLEMPPPILNIDSNNPSHTWPDGPTSAMEVDTNNKSSAPMPLTPRSLIDTQNQHEQIDTRMNRASIGHISTTSNNSIGYQVPPFVESPTYPIHPPILTPILAPIPAPRLASDFNLRQMNATTLAMPIKRTIPTLCPIYLAPARYTTRSAIASGSYCHVNGALLGSVKIRANMKKRFSPTRKSDPTSPAQSQTRIRRCSQAPQQCNQDFQST